MGDELGDVMTDEDKIKVLEAMQEKSARMYAGYELIVRFKGDEYLIDSNDRSVAESLGAKVVPLVI